MPSLLLEKAWCILLGTKYRSMEVPIIIHPKTLKDSGNLALSEYKIRANAGTRHMVIFA